MERAEGNVKTGAAVLECRNVGRSFESYDGSGRNEVLRGMNFEVHENAYEDMIFYTDMSEYSKKLPEQQRVILQGILTGKDDKEIAAELNVSRQYVNRIKKKMLSGENIF